MQIQFLPQRRINKFLALQSKVEIHYNKMARITSDDDLKELFSSLARHHSETRANLEEALFPGHNGIQHVLRKGKTYLGRLWKKVLSAILVNNRKKLLTYSRISETTLLQEVPPIVEENEISDQVRELLEKFSDQTKANLERISQMPEIP